MNDTNKKTGGKAPRSQHDHKLPKDTHRRNRGVQHHHVHRGTLAASSLMLLSLGAAKAKDILTGASTAPEMMVFTFALLLIGIALAWLASK